MNTRRAGPGRIAIVPSKPRFRPNRTLRRLAASAGEQLVSIEIPFRGATVYFPSEVIVVPVVLVIPSIVLVVRMAFRHREKMATLNSETGRSFELEQRLERIEQAVDAIALEMERVGEGQRFVTKLLAERPTPISDGQGAQRERVITPH